MCALTPNNFRDVLLDRGDEEEDDPQKGEVFGINKNVLRDGVAR